MPARERLPSMLELKGICKRYVTQSFTQVALDNVSLAFRDNEFVAILGPSGSGKTTMLNVIGGLDHFDSGDLLIDGISTKDFRDRDWDAYRNNRIGFVFQSYNLIPHQTILENVELALTLTGVGHAECRQRAREALEAVGLGEHVNKRPSQLSGGQMQRVAIARALINDPEIVLADEPTGALDSTTSVQVMDCSRMLHATAWLLWSRTIPSWRTSTLRASSTWRTVRSSMIPIPSMLPKPHVARPSPRAKPR